MSDQLAQGQVFHSLNYGGDYCHYVALQGFFGEEACCSLLFHFHQNGLALTQFQFRVIIKKAIKVLGW